MTKATTRVASPTTKRIYKSSGFFGEWSDCTHPHNQLLTWNAEDSGQSTYVLFPEPLGSFQATEGFVGYARRGSELQVGHAFFPSQLFKGLSADRRGPLPLWTCRHAAIHVLPPSGNKKR